MKSLIAAVLLLGASCVAAQADTFTFTGASVGPGNTIVAPIAGAPNPVVATFGASTAQTIYSTGMKTTSSSNCATLTTPPNSTFEANGACLFSETNGDKASIVFGCDFSNKERTAANCWGYLSGMAGARTGKTGTMSWHQGPSADGKGGVFSGTGQWGN